MLFRLFSCRVSASETPRFEHVFVVAKTGEHLLYYDDVEEDFGVAIPDGDGVLRNWGNFGPLVRAVLVLDEIASAV
jgi:hypothetical protein